MKDVIENLKISKSLSEMPSGINNIMNKYELLKKAWEEKKLQEVEKLLLELKIEFAATQPANERVKFIS